MRLTLNLRDVEDKFLLENFISIKQFVDTQPMLQGEWAFFEIVVPKAVTSFSVKHGLSFIPKDIIQTSLIGAGALTWNYTSFDKDYLNITTTGACTVRVFVGRYQKAG